jgi:large subunit ribosomal protein L4
MGSPDEIREMIDLAIYNRDGEEIDSLKVDESSFGGSVRYPLLKQSIVMYHANKRKLFRQKGTGNARVGNRRTGKRVGGGMTFAKIARDFSKQMPKKQRRLARDSAVLEKLLSNNVVVVDELGFEKPKTKDFVNVLDNLKILNKGSCLVTISCEDTNLYKSARNIPRIAVMPVTDLNAGDICNHSKMLFTKEAFLKLIVED